MKRTNVRRSKQYNAQVLAFLRGPCITILYLDWDDTKREKKVSMCNTRRCNIWNRRSWEMMNADHFHLALCVLHAGPAFFAASSTKDLVSSELAKSGAHGCASTLSSSKAAKGRKDNKCWIFVALRISRGWKPTASPWERWVIRDKEAGNCESANEKPCQLRPSPIPPTDFHYGKESKKRKVGESIDGEEEEKFPSPLDKRTRIKALSFYWSVV